MTLRKDFKALSVLHFSIEQAIEQATNFITHLPNSNLNSPLIFKQNALAHKLSKSLYTFF